MSNYDWVWSKCVTLFPILGKSAVVSLPECQQNNALTELLFELRAMNIVDGVHESVWLAIEEKLRTVVVPQFWAHFAHSPPPPSSSGDLSTDDEQTEQLCYKFQIAVTELHNHYQSLQLNVRMLHKFEQMNDSRQATRHSRFASCQAKFADMFTGILLSALPDGFERVVMAFYRRAFRQYTTLYETGDPDLKNGTHCKRCERVYDDCYCDPSSSAFVQTNSNLRDMELMYELTSGTVRQLLKSEIRRHVQITSHGQYDKSHLQPMSDWVQDVLMVWHDRVTGCFGHHEDRSVDSLAYEDRMIIELNKAYGSLLVDQFFNIIIDYPDSQPAIVDLMDLCTKVNFQQHIVEKTREALQKRLLHPGVNTNDILTGYVASIKALRFLDASGVLLNAIIEPVKDYMRSRADTVRCVVAALTEEGPADLAEELAKSEAESTAKKQKDEMNNWQNWKPDPVTANIPKVPAPNRSADIISMIVDIYGSKEMFVTEYRNLLADRLLTQLDFNPEKEVRNLELLKLRFGDTLLHNCEVMLKDIGDAKRIDAHIHEDTSFEFGISSLILSSQFWPQFKTETLKLPQTFQAQFDRYKASYEKYKANRTLVWRPVPGSVDLRIDIGTRQLDLTVTPTQACIISLFVDVKRWTLANMSAELDVPATVLRIRIGLWQTHGLIREEQPDVFVLVEDEDAAMPAQAFDATESIECDDGTESAMASASDQREEDLQVFWSYIVGMLTNLDSMQLERIHQMLKMFASHGPGAEFTQDELKNFLQSKVREHKLIYAGGVYQLPK